MTILDLGGAPVNVSAIIVTSSKGALVGNFTSSYRGSLSQKLPVFLTSGETSAVISTGIAYSSGTTYTFRVLTQRGTVFAGTYPPTATSLAAQALTSGAIGDLYLNFSSYTWYTVDYCSGNSGPYCLTDQGQAFTITYNTAAGACGVGFSVDITNLNPSNATITLDEYSHLLQWAFKPGTAVQSQGTFYVVGVHSSNIINASFAQISLPYGMTKLVYFASSNAGTPSCEAAGTIKPQGTTPPFIANVFIISHGWKWLGTMPATPNYGQNMAYVSSLYD